MANKQQLINIPKSVLLIGATGLVGNLTLSKLLENDSIREVRIITRRKTGIVHEKLKELVIDFELLKPDDAFMQCDVFINCLGSTMKKAGSKEAFERYDYFYPHYIAGICKNNGTSKMILLSAMGANKNSSIFYNKIKGRLEKECEQIGFDELIILQPSLLIGERKEKRFGEKIAQKLSALLSPLIPSKYKPVSAEILANTILYHTITRCPENVQRITYTNFIKQS